MVRAGLLGVVGAGLLGPACASEGPDPRDGDDAAASDAGQTETTGPVDAPCDGPLTLGLGAAPFSPLPTARVTLPLERGPQGLQHVVMSARAPVTPGFRPLTLALTAPGEPSPRAAMTLTLPWTASAEDAGLSEVVGVLFVIEAPDEVLEVPLTLSARVEAPAPSCAEAEVEVVWQ